MEDDFDDLFGGEEYPESSDEFLEEEADEDSFSLEETDEGLSDEEVFLREFLAEEGESGDWSAELDELGEEALEAEDALVTGILGKTLVARFSPLLVKWWLARNVAPVVRVSLRQAARRSRKDTRSLAKGITRCVVGRVVRDSRVLGNTRALKQVVIGCSKRVLRTPKARKARTTLARPRR